MWSAKHHIRGLWIAQDPALLLGPLEVVAVSKMNQALPDQWSAMLLDASE